MRFRRFLENSMTAQEALKKALFLQDGKTPKRIPELEPIILQDVYQAYDYARYIICGRWKELEDILLDIFPKEWACIRNYTINIMSRDWPEMERKFLTLCSKDNLDMYWVFVKQKKPWIELEDRIIRDNDSDHMAYYIGRVNTSDATHFQMMEAMIRRNPESALVLESALDLPEDLQDLAIQLGGLRILTKMKHVDPSIRKKYEKTSDLKRGGLFR